MKRTIEEKVQILQEAEETKNVSEVCRKYRLSPRLFRSWRAKLKAGGQAGLDRPVRHNWVSYPVLEESWTPEGHRITNFRCKSHRADEEREDEFKFDLLIAGGLRIEGIKFTWGTEAGKYTLPNLFRGVKGKRKKVLFLEDGPLKNSLNLHLDSLCIAAIRAGSTLFRVDTYSPPPPRQSWAEIEEEQAQLREKTLQAIKKMNEDPEVMARLAAIKAEMAQREAAWETRKTKERAEAEEKARLDALKPHPEPSLWPEAIETKEVKPKGFNNEFDFPLDASGYPLPSGHSSHEGDAE